MRLKMEWADDIAAEALAVCAHPRDIKHDKGFVFDDERSYLDIWWGGYEYSIELNRIDTPAKLLNWLQHLGQKTWKGMTARRVAKLIKALNHRYKWQGVRQYV